MTKSDANDPITCGVIMPISSIGECTESHWADVLSIITESVETVGFRADLVSNSDEVTMIHRTIVQNVYNSPVVVCDVSERNANVMFELGMRLAFDKPTVIIKDEKTPYSFDTSAIEHIEYPRDLRFRKIVDFKARLAEKVHATYEKWNSDPSYSTFLQHFGQFKVAKLEETEVESQEFILKQLEDIKRSIERVPSSLRRSRFRPELPDDDEVDVCCGPLDSRTVEGLKRIVEDDPRVIGARVAVANDHLHIFAKLAPGYAEKADKIESEFKSMARGMNRRPTLRKDASPRDGGGHD